MTRLAASLIILALVVMSAVSGTSGRSVRAARDASTCGPNSAVQCDSVEARLQTSAEMLIQKHSPILFLREQSEECDSSGEAYEPIAVDVLLDNPEIVLRDGDGAEIEAGPTAVDLFGGSEELYLDFPGRPRDPGCDYERDNRRLQQGRQAVTYARIVLEDGFDELALQYWFFYYFNDWNNTHEGDWEMIQLAFAATSTEEALGQTPIRIAYSQHSGGQVLPWDDEKLQREGEHPIVYPAAGSHANYFEPETYLGRAEQGAGFGCDDTSSPHRRIELEVRLMPDAVSDPADEYAWLTFEGRWGQLESGHFSGPTGPNRKEKWDKPFTWEQGLRSSDVKVPGQFLGPNAVDVFCSVVAIGSSTLLPVIEEWPLLFLAGLTATLGTIVYAYRHTRFTPAPVEPLRRRRRIGQILTASAKLYRRNVRLFLVIGAIFIPAGIVASLVQWIVFAPIDPILELTSNDLALRFAIALSLGVTELGLAYAFVFVVSTLAVRKIETGESVGVVALIREAWDSLRIWLPARLKAMLTVAALGISIIGIPWAIRAAIRYSFIEQSVLLDDETESPRKASNRLVDRDLWWVAASTLLILGVAIAAAPILGMLLLLAFRSAPLPFINFLTSAVYVLLTPYVAIAFAMIYFDLGEREDVTGIARSTA